MSDYIKRGYAKTAICSSCANPCSLAEKANNPCVTVIELERIPSADVAPVRHGHWRMVSRLDEVEWLYGVVTECSQCKHEEVAHYQYCPNCGAKMDEEKDDEL